MKKCSRCGFPIVRLMSYVENDDGRVLCLDCFNEVVKKDGENDKNES